MQFLQSMPSVELQLKKEQSKWKEDCKCVYSRQVVYKWYMRKHCYDFFHYVDFYFSEDHTNCWTGYFTCTIWHGSPYTGPTQTQENLGD